MVPGNKFDKPGKSPFMDMMLVPVYADGDSRRRARSRISPRIQQNLGVRTAAVTEGTLSPQVAAVGSIAFNERDQAVVQARATGFVERLHVRATLDRVRQGPAAASSCTCPTGSPRRRSSCRCGACRARDLAALVDGARQRMRQVGHERGADPRWSRRAARRSRASR